VRALQDLAAERGLPDPGRASHEQRRGRALRSGRELFGPGGEVALAADERPLAEAHARGAAVVQRPRRGARLRTELAQHGDPQPLVPADRDVAPARLDGRAHELLGRGLVGRLELDQPLPVGVAA